MRMRHFTPRQPLADIRITPQEWKPGPEVSRHSLYAGAWECENGKPIFDAKKIQCHPVHPKF